MTTLVGKTYDLIAADFSRTRYKIWPCVSKFLDPIILSATISAPSIICEIGCGNGKNLAYLLDSPAKTRIRAIGVDISAGLLEICRGRGIESMLGSILSIPLADQLMDYTLSVAVIHHLPEKKDRLRALNELARITKIGGRCLITVWARQQTAADGKRRFATNDEMVPFKTKSGETHYRFYHLYEDGELAEDLALIQEFQVVELFIERGNYVAELQRI